MSAVSDKSVSGVTPMLREALGIAAPQLVQQQSVQQQPPLTMEPMAIRLSAGYYPYPPCY